MIYELFEEDHRTTFQNLSRFYDVLGNLRHEGKMQWGKNVSEIRGLTAYFKKELNGHMKEEEKTLFPFLRTHIPRLEPMVCLLLSEHEDFRHSLEILSASLNEFFKNGSLRPGSIDRIYEQGTYLICLLRSHMQVESTSLYKAADEELRPAEKKALIDQMKQNGARVCGRRHRTEVHHEAQRCHEQTG